MPVPATPPCRGPLVLCWILTFIVAGPLTARNDGDTQALPDLVVSGSPFTATAVATPRSISIITREQIEATPAATLAELLDQVAGVDVQRRGAAGVQADIGIRGTAFEQTLILLDGIPLRDPQTGHHSLNLPVPLAMIERIEIVKGPGGLDWAGLATGGVVHIITRKPTVAGGGAKASIGRHDYRAGEAWWLHGNGDRGHKAALESSRSDGHLDERPTGFDMIRAYYGGHRRLGDMDLNWGGGYERRDFGAWMFYTADFPYQSEKTRTRLLWAGLERHRNGWQFQSRLWWRGHDDWFLTRVGERDFINVHRTSNTGLSLSMRHQGTRVETAWGARVGLESIDSNALGERDREEYSLWVGQRWYLSPDWTLEGGLAVLDLARTDPKWLPSLAVNWQAGAHWQLYAAAGRNSRPASWTEQQLVTRGNLGNPGLGHETIRQLELGWRWQHAAHRLQAALYERRSDALIDWGRVPGSVQWQAQRFEDYRSRGAEFEWRWQRRNRGWLRQAGLGYAYNHTRLDERGLQIKYASDYPEHALKADLRIVPFAGLALDARARVARRSTGAHVHHLALRAGGRLRPRLDWFIEIDNLLDENDPEAGFAPRPGRWWFAGLQLTL